MSSSKYETLEEIERRVRFYNSEKVQKYLKKYGVPKSKRAMKDFIAATHPTSADPDIVESVSQVHFEVHPQQINVRDRANGKIIASIEK